MSNDRQQAHPGQQSDLGQQVDSGDQPASPLAVSLVVGFIVASITASLPGGVGTGGGFFAGVGISLLAIYGSALVISYRRMRQMRQERERTAEQTQRRRELLIASQRVQNEALQAYLGRMAQLLTDKDRPLYRAEPGDRLSAVARALTLTMLEHVDGLLAGGSSKGNVLEFLYESGLIYKDRVVLNLRGANFNSAEAPGQYLGAADLRNVHFMRATFRWAWLPGADLAGALLYDADLSNANLSEADLSEADLTNANLSEALLYDADLSNADLSNADLSEVNLSGANLSGANLSEANLSEAFLVNVALSRAYLHGANVTQGQLAQVSSLEGAIMPNGQKYKDWLEDKEGSGKDAEKE